MTAAASQTDAATPVDGVTVNLADGVLSVTIDRPDSLNSVTTEVLAAIADAMESAGADPRVKAVRLGGAGRGFCSGAQLSGDADEVPTETVVAANRAIRAITALPRPVIAVVQGPAAGVGVSLALACDLVLAAETAFFTLAFTKVGLMPDGGASALVAAAVGRTRALRMALLAERLPAPDAAAAGLIAAVYPPDELDARAAAVAAQLATGPAVALANTKLAVNAATLSELDGALHREYVGQSALLAANDFREGQAAFQQRRAASFTDAAPRREARPPSPER